MRQNKIFIIFAAKSKSLFNSILQKRRNQEGFPYGFNSGMPGICRISKTTCLNSKKQQPIIARVIHNDK